MHQSIEGGELRTLRLFGGDGSPITVPTLSGNSLGGRIRRDLAYDLFSKLDINPIEAYSRGKGPQKVTFHTFTSGGALKADTNVKDAMIREIQSIFPMLSLLGGVYGGSFTKSKCSIGHAIPASTYLRTLFPSSLSNDLFSDIAPEDTYTKSKAFTTYRMPDHRTAIGLPEEEVDEEKKSKNKESPDLKKKNEFRNMPVSFDYILPNIPFLIRIGMYDSTTPLEWSMLGFALQKLQAHPYLAAKAKGGFGLVEWHMPDDKRLDPTLYHEYIEQNKAVLRDILLDPKGFIYSVQERKSEIVFV